MTGVPDTAEERTAEWGRAGDGIEARVRELAARDKACCPFLDFTVTTAPGEVRWDVTVAEGTVMDDGMTGTIMDEFYSLPDTVGDGVAGMVGRLTERGLQVSTNGSGTVLQMQPAPADA